MAYHADASRLEPGSIVKIENPNSSTGSSTYAHFFVVLSVPNRIGPGDQIALIGITSRINQRSADPAKHIPMKWLNRPGGDPDTGFIRPCFACVDFTHVLTVYRGDVFPMEVAAEHMGKSIRATTLQTIIAAVNAWTRRT